MVAVTAVAAGDLGASSGRVMRATVAPGQLTLAEFITSHAYDRHIRSCRLCYRRRRDLLIARLAPGPEWSLPGLRIGGIAAGLQTLLSLPAEASTSSRSLRTVPV